MLQTSSPLWQDEDVAFHSKASVQQYVDPLIYFALSVFWKASVTNWGKFKRINLGATYNERLRTFLIGESSFPDNVALMVDCYSFESSALNVVLFPFGGSDRGFYQYKFSIPGIAFHLFLGQLIPEDIAKCSINNDELGLIMSSRTDSSVIDAFGRLCRHHKPTKR